MSEVLSTEQLQERLAALEQENQGLRMRLREGEQRFCTMADAIPQLAWVAHADGYIHWYNRRCYEYTGITPQRLEGWGWQSAHDPELLPAVLERWKASIATGKPTEMEFSLRGADGQFRRFLTRVVPLKDEQGRVVQWFGTHTDVEEMRQVEQRLRKVNRTLRALSDSNRAVVRATDEVRFVQEVCQIIVHDCGHRMAWVGYAREDEARTVEPIAWAGVEEGYVQAARITWANNEHGRGPTGTAIRTGRPFVCNNFANNPVFGPWKEEASRRGYASSISLPLMADGKVFGALMIYSDQPAPFSEEEVQLLVELADNFAYGIRSIRWREAHAQATAAERESKEKLALALRCAGMGVWRLDLHGPKRYFDEQVCRCLGIDPDDFAGTADEFYAAVHPGDHDHLRSALERTIATGAAYELDYRAVWPDGSVHYIATRARLIRDAEGRPHRIDGLLWDITGRKRIEARLRRFYEAELFAFLYWKIDGGVLDVNDQFLKMTGYTREDVRAGLVNWSKITPPEFHEMDEDARRQVRETGIHLPYEKQYIRKDGTRVWGLFSAAAYEDDRTEGISFILDITQRKQAEEALRATMGRIALLADTASELLRSREPQKAVESLCRGVMEHLDCHAFFNFMVDHGAGKLHLNACAGISEEQVRRIEWMEFGSAVCGCSARDACRIVVEHIPATPDVRAELVKSFGLKAYACHPLLEPDGGVIGTLSFGTRTRETFSEQDLSLMKTVADHVAVAMARQHAEESLRQARAEAEAASKAKDHFLAVLSHELRNPLNPVLATASMLCEDARFDADTHEQLEIIRRNAELEARLIDDLLDVTRIERGKVELDRHPVELGTVLGRAVEVCRPDIEARKLEFSVDAGEGPCWVNADAARLQQVFWNLIKNAIKFTPSAGWVGIRCRKDEGEAVIEVRDSGVGIEPQVLPRLFNAFEQAERSITRQFGGLGLGLAISKALVEMHGGTIRADSEGKGTGATFTVRLPLLPSQPGIGAAVPKARQMVLQPGATSSLRILLVEDHGDTARIMRRLLAAEGHEVELAADIATALRLAGNKCFDLLLSDLGLPDGSGLDLMQELRGRGLGLPGIALSGYGQEKDLQESQEVGFSAHLTKPVNVERLKEAIAKLGQGDGTGINCQ